MEDKEVWLALVVGVVAAVVTWLLIGANDGMHGRMNVVLAAVWLSAGREGVTLLMGLIAGFLTWALRTK